MGTSELNTRLQEIATRCLACIEAEAEVIKQQVSGIARSLIEINQARNTISQADLVRVLASLRGLVSDYSSVPALKIALQGHIHFLELHAERMRKHPTADVGAPKPN